MKILLTGRSWSECSRTAVTIAILFSSTVWMFSGQLALAAVVINEIAWMGTAESANNEWIELYNDANTTVDLTDWELTDGDSFSVALAGSLQGGRYGVLERTDDDSSPGTAFLVYTGALANTGATLSLYNVQGQLVDRVAGGEDWTSVGGDNETKATAQLTTAGWLTGVSTPGSRNVSADEAKESLTDDSDEEGGDEDEAVVKTKTTTRPRTSSEQQGTLRLAPSQLAVRVTVPKTVQVNEQVTVSAEGYGVPKGIENSLTYRWNFGDMTAVMGREVNHRYVYPGNYVVTLKAQYKDYDAEYDTVVTVLPRSFSLSRQPNGDLQLHNNAKYEVDISEYVIAGYTMPARSRLLPAATLTIPSGKQTAEAMVWDDAGKLVVALESVPAVALESVVGGEVHGAAASPPPHVPPHTPQPAVAPILSQSAEPVMKTIATTEPLSVTPTSTVITAGSAETSPTRKQTDWPMVLLVGLLMTATFGMYTKYL